MDPRATSIKEQGFSEAVAARIEAPQRGSTRSVYEASGPFLQIGASLIRWTSGHPLVKSVCDFLMYLLRTGSYSPAPLMVTGQPLLITGKFTLQNQQGQNLARLLDSFHRDRPKGQKRVQTVWPQWLYKPWPPTLDRYLKSDRSLFPVRPLRYYLDRTSGRIRRWLLSPLRKISTKTSHLPLSPLGSSRL